MARYGSYGSHGTLWQLWHVMTVMARSHYCTVNATPNSHVVFLKCLATAVQTETERPGPIRQYSDQATEGITEKSGSIPDNSRDFTLIHRIQTVSGIHSCLYRQLQREAAHTSACSVKVKNAWGYNISRQ